MTGPSTSSIVYQDAPPSSVGEAAVEALAGLEVRWSGGEGSLHAQADRYPGALVPRADFLTAAAALREKAGFIWFVDHSAVDYPERQPARFTVVMVLMNMATQERLMLKCHAAEGESVPSVTSLWEAANWAERETYDMFGIPFEGHPELTRIYMPEDYDGWPMRRDFPLQGHLRFQD